jgi:hypothetical protein
MKEEKRNALEVHLRTPISCTIGHLFESSESKSR